MLGGGSGESPELHKGILKSPFTQNIACRIIYLKIDILRFYMLFDATVKNHIHEFI